MRFLCLILLLFRLSYWNVGQLAKKYGKPLFLPCTTKAILQLLHLASLFDKNPTFDLGQATFESLFLQENSLESFLKHRRITILGRSDIVGMPTFLSLLKLNASVRLCHSHSLDTMSAIKDADILIVAIGQPQWVKPEWIKPKAIVIDVGIHIHQNQGNPIGKIVGDVDQSSISKYPLIQAITPVPGGVGPMTIAMLLDNILLSAEKST
jgi:methylenetetrahydrofolate dehydrogenase (NADP+) / methenyltetrahydrofolate cyclohydrolase / formyltetrahydrofolate synthetase